MADANPSRPGNANEPLYQRRMEVNIPEDIVIVRKTDGRIVRRTQFQTGSTRETEVFPGDYDKKVVIDEREILKEAMANKAIEVAAKAVADAAAIEDAKKVPAKSAPTTAKK